MSEAWSDAQDAALSAAQAARAAAEPLSPLAIAEQRRRFARGMVRDAREDLQLARYRLVHARSRYRNAQPYPPGRGPVFEASAAVARAAARLAEWEAALDAAERALMDLDVRRAA